MSRILVLADIHGNSAALDAVLRDSRKYKPDFVLSLGDVIDIGPDPRGVAERLVRLNATRIDGNHDYDEIAALGNIPPATRAYHDWSIQQLGDCRGEVLRPHSLVQNLCDPGIFAVHGVFKPDGRTFDRAHALNYYLSVDGKSSACVKPADAAEWLSGVHGRCVLSGHYHQPSVVRVVDGQVRPDGKLSAEQLYQPNGVDLSLDEPGLVFARIPPVGVVERVSGKGPQTPGLAGYAILDCGNGLLQIRAVPYDVAPVLNELERVARRAGCAGAPLVQEKALENQRYFK